MSQEVDQLTVNIGELEITVRRNRTASSGSSPSGPSLAGPRATAATAAPAGLAESPTGSAWSVVGRDRPAPWTREWEADLFSASDQASILAVDLQPVEHLATRLSSSATTRTPLARLGRALRAGLGARYVLRGEAASCTSPDTGLRSRIFVVLRGAPGFEPCHTESAEVYFKVVHGGGSSFHRESVSHAFATRAEADAYIIGAGERWPPLRQQP